MTVSKNVLNGPTLDPIMIREHAPVELESIIAALSLDHGKSLENWVQDIERYEKHMLKNTSKKEGKRAKLAFKASAGVSMQGLPTSCQLCNGFGHDAKICKKYTVTKKIQDKSFTCYGCGEAGHMARDCPKKTSKKAFKAKVKQQKEAAIKDKLKRYENELRGSSGSESSSSSKSKSSNSNSSSYDEDEAERSHAAARAAMYSKHTRASKATVYRNVSDGSSSEHGSIDSTSSSVKDKKLEAVERRLQKNERNRMGLLKWKERIKDD
jgi:hypothetical protein